MFTYAGVVDLQMFDVTGFALESKALGCKIIIMDTAFQTTETRPV